VKNSRQRLKEFFERGGVKIYTLRKKEEPGLFLATNGIGAGTN
jgi:hypothetical protein